jgi:hypothetical protein
MAKDFQYGDAPIEPAYRKQMTDLAHHLDAFFNGGMKGKDRHTGFILLVFPFGEKEGRCNYISNGAAREDVVVMLKEQIARFEGQAELKGKA